MPDQPSSTHPIGQAEQTSAFRFGPFALIPSQRLLLESGKPIKLGSRAFDILALLLEKAGQVVTRDELLALVWPATVVEEVNLRVHVAALRRALGDGQRGNRYIVNSIRRGYRFVGTVTSGIHNLALPKGQSSSGAQHNLPSVLIRIVGRTGEVEHLVRLAGEHRFLTLAGPAGVGKSTLALATAREILGQFRDGTYFVDLGAVSDTALVPSAFATSLGLSVSLGTPLEDLVDYLKTKSLLLVLDNCELQIDAAARTTEGILRQCAGVHIMATSREPLSAEGEWLYQVTPLALPDDEAPLTAETAQQYAAVELFVERAVISDHRFKLTDDNASIVAHICRSLDGLPLAIELAAARANLHGIRELAARLEELISRLANGRRTAASRHQTLWASLDWSYGVLIEKERTALRRLAVFHGAFTMESGIGLVAQEGLSTQDASAALVALADKSLITTDVSGDTARYRLLNTTRAYAFEKLSEAQEIGIVVRKHGEQTLRLMRKAELGWETMARSEWIANYAYAIDDVRAALNWAFSTDGDASLGASLTVVSMPFGFQLGLTEEFRARAEYALGWVTAQGAAPSDVEMRLRGALSALSNNMRRPRRLDDAVQAPLTQRLRTPKQQITPLLQKTIYQIEVANYEGALSTAETLSMLARKIGDPLALLMADRVSAQAQHFCGNHAAARIYAERVLDHPAKGIPLAYQTAQVDRRVSMRIVLARINWLEGHAHQSLVLVKEALHLAATDSPFALCQTLALAACPIALWCGRHEEAREHVATLLRESDRYRLEFWRSYGEWFRRAVGPESAMSLDIESDHRSRESISGMPGSGLLLDTMLTIDPSIEGVQQALSEGPKWTGWSGPERLRVQGQLLLDSSSEHGHSEAEMYFLRSIEAAEQQNALAWNLRASMSLAKLWTQQHRRRHACDLLNSVVGRFSEGFDTKDLSEAAVLIKRIA